MRSILQNSIIKKTAGLMLGAALSLFSTDAFAVLKTALVQNAIWDNPNHWAPAGVPLKTDDVVIDGVRTVTIPAGFIAECLSLNIDASGNADGTKTMLDVNGQNIYVYGNIALISPNGNNKPEAELRLSGGTVYIVGSGTISPATTTQNRIITLNNGTTGPNGSIVTGASPLPVELVNFTAAKKAGEVGLNWETASEKNNSGFEVQASFDGKNYEAVAFVASRNGNSSAAQRYAYSHKTANQEGLVYFRLKQVDLDGTFEYYTAKAVDLGRFNATANTFPNPFQNRFELNLTTAATETADILVIDMTGKTVYAAKQNLSKGANTISVELNNQPAGLYLLKATAGNQTYTNRLVKQ